MSTRISSLFLCLAPAACGGSSMTNQTTPEPAARATADARVPCARGAEELARVCTMERARTDAGIVLTLRHPDGAFRRLLVTADGRGVAAADGAEPARVTIVAPGEIAVGLGDARYRLPARVTR